MSLDEDVESMTGLENTYTYPRVIPQQVYVAIAAESSDAAASRRPTEFLCTVTMPDGVTNLTITAEMAAKADKVIKECTMMPADATREEMLTFQYFNWQESLRLRQVRATLEERKKQASLSSARRRQLSLSSTGRADTRPRSRLSHLSPDERAALTRNLGNSFMTYDEEGVPVPKIAAGALFTAAAYLEAIKPPADDPNAKLHRQQIKSLAPSSKGYTPNPKHSSRESRSCHN